SPVFDFVEALVLKDNIGVNDLIEKNPELLAIAHKFFLQVVNLDTTAYLDEFEKNFPELYEKLLHFKDRDNANALLWAIFNGYYSTAERLIEKGADKKLTDRWGYNLSENLKQGLTHKLENCIYNRFIQNFNYDGPLISLLALDNYRQRIVEEYFFEKIKEHQNQKIYEMSKSIPDLFLKLINCTDANGNTPLMYAAKGNKELLLSLLDMKANHEVRNKEGKTAFQIAKKCDNNQECIQILKNLEKNRNIHLKILGIFSFDRSKKIGIEAFDTSVKEITTQCQF
ncbi:MAG TPA: ankyrin repeat domain-containing protein, partial [Gammaproteobacteria bacterium]|nr:ankyrin repeat domain-containing protein [Gammaproteobacteria bacterium]